MLKLLPGAGRLTVAVVLLRPASCAEDQLPPTTGSAPANATSAVPGTLAQALQLRSARNEQLPYNGTGYEVPAGFAYPGGGSTRTVSDG